MQALGRGAVADVAVEPFLVVMLAIVLNKNASFRDAEHEFSIEG